VPGQDSVSARLPGVAIAVRGDAECRDRAVREPDGALAMVSPRIAAPEFPRHPPHPAIPPETAPDPN